MKIFLTAIIFCITVNVNSQVQLGLFGGPQATTVHYVINGNKQDHGFKYGINLGAGLKVPFENRLSFVPSVMYNLRGYKVDFSSPSYPPDTFAIDNNTSFHTVELAFLLQHDFKTEAGHWFLKIGPSLDFALFGKETYHTSTSTIKRNMIFSFGDYGHYLASAILQLGYEAANGVFFYGHYNYSLTTMNNFDEGPRIGNRAAGISIGKYLTRKKIVLDTKNKQ